jgi:hypothetical protein
MRSRAALFAAILTLDVAIGAAHAHDHQETRGRLIVSDREKAVLRVLDLDSGDWTHAFDLPRPNPTLATSHDGRYVFVLTGDDAGTVRVLDTGLVAESHGDHTDTEKRAVRMLDFAVTGERPSHVVSGHGWASVFFDGPRGGDRRTGTRAVLIDLASLGAKQVVSHTWTSPGAQHGLAVPLGSDAWAVSLPKKAYVDGDAAATSLPNGLAVVRARQGWKRIAAFDDAGDPARSCKEMHGHATSGGAHVFGCNGRSHDASSRDGGLLVLAARSGGKWAARKLVYPDDRRVSVLTGRAGGAHLVGNFGRERNFDALIRVDPKGRALTAGDVFAIPDGQPACRFALSENGRRVVNLLPDGSVRVYEHSPAWQQVARFEAVPPFDCGQAGSGSTPSLAVVGRSAFVSDPANGRIHEYDLATLKQGLDIAFDGIPGSIAPGASD